MRVRTGVRGARYRRRYGGSRRGDCRRRRYRRATDCRAAGLPAGDPAGCATGSAGCGRLTLRIHETA
jgi:hypothetical protein